MDSNILYSGSTIYKLRGVKEKWTIFPKEETTTTDQENLDLISEQVWASKYWPLGIMVISLNLMLDQVASLADVLHKSYL